MLPWRNYHAVHQGLSEDLSKNTHSIVDHHSIMSFGESTPYLPLTIVKNPGLIIVHCFFWCIRIHHVQTNPTIFGVFGSKPRCQVTLTSKGYHQYYVTFPPVSTHRGCGRTRGVEYIFQWLGSQGAMASGTKKLRVSIFSHIPLFNGEPWSYQEFHNVIGNANFVT